MFFIILTKTLAIAPGYFSLLHSQRSYYQLSVFNSHGDWLLGLKSCHFENFTGFASPRSAPGAL
jgi:hypothetical protein